MNRLIFSIVALGIGFSTAAYAKEVIVGEPAQKLYFDMIELQKKNPKEMTSFVNGYFGDAERPELGKLWVTTIYPTATKDTFCYEYDFRESNFKEYRCELLGEHSP